MANKTLLTLGDVKKKILVHRALNDSLDIRQMCHIGVIRYLVIVENTLYMMDVVVNDVS